MAIKQRSKSLQSRGSALSSSFFQLEVLNGREITDTLFPPFGEKMAMTTSHQQLSPTPLEIFQINIGKLCNQSCLHCHVDAGPDRKKEMMSKENLDRCLEIIAQVPSIQTVDITGGAPEMHEHFKWFVTECRRLGKQVINRCNLTIIRANPKYHELPSFFAEQNVHIVSSLPYYNEKRTDRQRGEGVFQDSIEALQMLNEIGYGMEGSPLRLDLVYNPAGAFLPDNQMGLETEFKRQLIRKYNIHFHHLLAITNMPISRFLEYLLQAGKYKSYMQSLVEAYNPATVDGLMCRNTISVSWEGNIHDCDFNQMLNLKVACSSHHISNFDLKSLQNRNIVLNQHCYGCTAGAGSSCGGEVS